MTNFFEFFRKLRENYQLFCHLSKNKGQVQQPNLAYNILFPHHTGGESALRVVCLADGRKSLCIPAHSKAVLECLSAYQEHTALGVQDIPFSSDLHKVPLMARVGRSGVGVDIVARNPDTVAQRLHSSGKAGTLRFPVYEGTPGRIGVVVLPSYPPQRDPCGAFFIS